MLKVAGSLEPIRCAQDIAAALKFQLNNSARDRRAKISLQACAQ
jgi:hypothetical protein